MTTTPGSFVWYELLTANPKAAIAFYEHVVGWSTQPFGQGDYTIVANQEGGLGGVVELPGDLKKMGARPYWAASVQVVSLEKTMAEAQRLGGRALSGPTEFPEVGRVAVIGDPDGVPIHLFTPARTINERNRKVPGAFVWHELFSNDHERSFTFYSQLFGWRKSRDFDMGAMGNYLIYNTGGPDIGGMFTRPKEAPQPMWMYYAQVKDLAAAIERAKSRGGKVLIGPMDVPGGAHVAQIVDPQGATIALHEEPRSN